ncbi:hypothetical protein CPAR01_09058 [Colletotrichum paranaense]|uniref:Uncharacterized protein n=5 Tax=Colletotrichum acutatum species complex TaxID=2707335 RepID=A0A9P9X9X6_9PEZI|nr:uncharacterized protein CLUP02_03346 [Colletotrichum lupini]XP_060347454.1 uncharacterized protein CPAR01_09058 [Colletotrichum paranaense]KAI3544166.1 hypothetical protein CABS02_09840 [Colletotrichum abscissum]KAK0373323.1 hypothetical protein CLIM01_09333 [Colletotrichum limetticola]KAK1466702.1 hypothetical protein CMEL01_10695 [Colletotrichum melonis]KAK1535516.1 hypothetical protein CPAR01_09058 [Colletotrichum paranaense]UQC77874.1 hypothetical protein CLUP02_03346 [Colletotrichum l
MGSTESCRREKFELPMSTRLTLGNYPEVPSGGCPYAPDCICPPLTIRRPWLVSC